MNMLSHAMNMLSHVMNMLCLECMSLSEPCFLLPGNPPCNPYLSCSSLRPVLNTSFSTMVFLILSKGFDLLLFEFLQKHVYISSDSTFSVAYNHLQL